MSDVNTGGQAPIRLLLADDHPVYRRGLARLLGSVPDVEVVAQAATGQEAIDMARKYCPDVALMDIEMPDIHGISVCRAIHADPLCHDVKIVFLTVFSEDAVLEEATAAGCVGYLLKEADMDDIIRGVRTVARGQSFFSPEAASGIRRQLSGRINQDRAVKRAGLTEREYEVLSLMVKAQTNRQIAAELDIAERTVKNHVGAIFRKLGVSDRSQAIIQALKKGIASLE